LKQRVIVAALVEKEGHYLFLRQGKTDGAYQGFLHIPGGGVNPGEDLEDAIRREVREEANIEISDVHPVNFDSENIPFYKGEPHQLVFLQFAAKYESGTPTPGSDATELLWLRPADFSSYPLNAPTLRLLRATGILESGFD
jgi:nucleoside triphosphatase